MSLSSPSEDNYALASTGATIVDVSHEALHVASAASNLLLEREDMLWITSDAPQSVTIRITPNHPPITFVGWHVWHDYLSNPKVVEVASGILPDCLNTAIVCNALPGAGTQLWEVTQPIPSAHQYIRFTIQSTFAPGPTYMNNVCLFAQNPGPKYSRMNEAAQHQAIASRVHNNAAPYAAHATSNLATGSAPNSRATSQDVYNATQQHQHVGASAAAVSTTSGAGRSSSSGVVAGSVPISNLLRDLDEDIKSLHPIRTVSPTRNVVFSQPNNAASLPTLVDTEIGEYVAAAHRRSPSAQQLREGNLSALHRSGQVVNSVHDSLSVVDNTTFRLAALETAVTSLSRALENQRQEIASIRELLVAQKRQPSQPQSSKHHHQDPVAVNFPEESLKLFIEEVLAPKLAKLAKRTETHTLERVEEHVAGMLDNVSDVVDRRVRGYLRHLSGDHGVTHFGGVQTDTSRQQKLRDDFPRDDSSHRRGVDAGGYQHRERSVADEHIRGGRGDYDRPVQPASRRR
ncbi:Hypothetical protein, putative [Bodo saltans]|uniref:Uncharacterized protein n=1 Tax=Bodo saltans TaxID=75058 RepID=A0A0S4JNV6_BODSA|nr:Hypothetical protein, putative [Bodo saltans]|eukprot:CUG91914.1 Hypothetical protein, putative [Bodo saltans]